MISSSLIQKILFFESFVIRLKRYPLQVRHKQDQARGFILLLPQAVVLPKSDAGIGVIKPALSFVIQNRRAPIRAR